MDKKKKLIDDILRIKGGSEAKISGTRIEHLTEA
jgi:hypothetical protein